MANDSGLGWRDVFSQVGFDVTAIQSETTIPSPPGSGGIWSLAEIHQAMLDHREEIDADGSRRVNLDNEWRYHVLAVPTVEFTGHPRGVRGIMYDVAATDSNKVPREGVAVSAKWIHPAKGTIINPSEPATDPLNREPDWGLDTGKAFDQAGNGYFRATVHEIGHCMGLLHNDEYPAPHGEPIDNTFMCPSDSIAAAATPALKYPQNIQWRFSDFNLRRLRHYPDIHVRPGGLDILTKHPQITPFLDSHTVIPGLKLELVPILKELPLGAPVRLDVKLINTGSMAIEVPIDISLKSSSISGSVETPHGNLKDFRPLIHCADESDNQTTLLQPDDSIQSSITLLRGPQGALFPTTGISTITVRAIWKIDDFPITVTGSTTVYIHGAHSESHAAAAHRILTTPDTHLVLVLGAADHLTEGVEAIQQAVQDETLGPHFAGIEAKRLVRKFGSRDVDFERVSKLIKNGAVLSEMEKRGLEGLFRKKGRGLSFGG